MPITTTTVSAARSVSASRTEVQKLITKYGLAAHLALLAVAPLFLSSIPIIYLSVLTAVWVIMEPSRVGQEMLHDARRRVIRGLVRDPLFWVLILLAVISGVRALNTGVGMSYDAETARWSIAAPAMPIMPGSVAGSGLSLFVSALAILVIVSGCRHALGRSARYAFLLVASTLTGLWVLGNLVFIHDQTALMAKLTMCEWTRPSYVGCAYGVMFIFALMALEAIYERKWWRSMPMAVFALCGNAVGLFFFAPPSMTVLFVGASLVLVAYSFVYMRFKVGSLSDFKGLVVLGVSLTLAGVIAMAILPDQTLVSKVEPYTTGDFLSSNFLAVRDVLSRISLKIWKINPWLGFGLGSFPIDLKFNATATDWSVITALQRGPLNGYWLLLVERGVIGAFFLAVPLALLLVTYIHRLIFGLKTLPHPLCWTAPVILIVAVLDMFIGCSFLSPRVLVPMLALFAISTNAFPKEKSSHG